MKTIKIALFAALASTFTGTLTPTAAFAQDEEEATGPVEVDFELGVFSDYRFRGLSLSGKEPQATAELSLAHESGFYTGAWLSNVDVGNGADDVELDLYLGYATDLGGVTLDVGGIYYVYPSNSDLEYFEFTGSLGTTVGPADVAVGVAYAPSQGALSNTDNTYVYVSGEVPLGDSPLSLHGTFGFEDGAFGDSKKDWLVGVSADVGAGFTITADYVDTARSGTNAGDPTAVVSLTKAF